MLIFSKDNFSKKENVKEFLNVYEDIDIKILEGQLRETKMTQNSLLERERS